MSGDVILNNEIELINNFDLLFEKKIVLYGTGLRGMETYGRLKNAGLAVSYLCDTYKCNDQTINGLMVLSPNELKQLDEKEDILVIITVVVNSFFNEIIKTVSNLKLRTSNIYSKYALDIALAHNINDPRLDTRFHDIVLYTEKLRMSLHKEKKSYLSLQCMMDVIENPSNILLYQPGKVGSITINSSLSRIGIPHIHVHYLNKVKSCLLPPPSEVLFSSNERQDLYQCLENFKNILKIRRPIKIITLVRDPISWNFAAMLQVSESYSVHGIMKMGGSFVDDCNEWFKKRITYDSDNIFNWFDDEIKAVFDVDIFDYPFNKEKGFTIIEQDNVEILLMKTEKLNYLEKVIGDFVNTSHFKLINDNVGEKKSYSYFYNQMKEAVKVPREYISRYYDGNPRMDHFYTEEEKAAFLKKWEKNFVD